MVTGRPLRICMPIFFYFPVIMGGAEQQARRLAQELVRRGNQVTIVTGWWQRSVPRREVEDGVEVYRNSTLWDCWDGVKLLRMLKHYAYELSLACYLWRRRRDYDVIHVHQALHTAFVSTLVGRLIGKPVLVKIGCGGEFGDRQLMQGCRVSPLGRQFWSVIRHCDAVVAISGEIRDELVADGFAPESIVSIANGIPADAVASKGNYRLDATARIASVGRLDPQKGFDVLLQALAALGTEAPDCAIFGEGLLREPLQKMVQNQGLTGVVALPGVVHDLKRRLPDFDLFVLPSRSEGMSNALMEALASGLPCVATNIGGNSDLIAPEGAFGVIEPGGYRLCSNGVLVNPDDSAGLAGAIRYLLGEEALRRELGQRARSWVEENLAISTVATHYLELYERLLQPYSSCVGTHQC